MGAPERKPKAGVPLKLTSGADPGVGLDGAGGHIQGPIHVLSAGRPSTSQGAAPSSDRGVSVDVLARGSET